jgi:hypothetical protein
LDNTRLDQTTGLELAVIEGVWKACLAETYHCMYSTRLFAAQVLEWATPVLNLWWCRFEQLR